MEFVGLSSQKVEFFTKNHSLEIFKHILQLSNDSNSWYYRGKELIPVMAL